MLGFLVTISFAIFRCFRPFIIAPELKNRHIDGSKTVLKSW